MKKTLALVLALVMMLSLLACAKTEEPAPAPATGGTDTGKPADTTDEKQPPAELPTITLWTGGSQNVSDVFTEVIAAYNARQERTANVELQFILSGTGDEGLSSRVSAAYLAGEKDTEFDMIAENTPDFQPYVDETGTEDILRPIDYSKLSNWTNVGLKPSRFDGKVVPFRGTTVVFAYDSAKLPNPPQTWAELTDWIKANDGRFAYNGPSTGGAGKGFVQTAVYNFIEDPAARMSSDAVWKDQWTAGIEWLKEIHPYLYKSGGGVVYPNKNQGALDILASGEVYLIPAWADQVMTQKEAGTLPATVEMYQLSDGSLSGSDVSIGICSIGKYNEECYDFLNFVISPEGQQIFVDKMKAVPVIDGSLLEQTASVKTVAALNPDDFAFLAIGSLSDELNDLWAEEITTIQ